MKSTLSFLGEKGEGFIFHFTHNTNKDMKPFNVKVEIKEPKFLEENQSEAAIHMEIAMDVLSKLMSVPDIFEMEFDGFDIHTMNKEDIDKAQGPLDPRIASMMSGMMGGPIGEA